MNPRWAVLPLLLTLAACGATPARAPETPFLRSVRQLNPDGTSTQLDSRQLSTFQAFMRARLSGGDVPGRTGWEISQPPKPAAWNVFATQPAVIIRLLTLEADVPQPADDLSGAPASTGNEGAYAAVLLFGDPRQGTVDRAEFQYYEQSNHAPRYDRYFHRALTSREQSDLLAFLKAHPPETLPLPTKPAPDVPTPGLQFRFTSATSKEATAVVIAEPADADRPAIDLLRLFAGFRDAESPPLICTYLRAIPTNATILFAHPQHWATALALDHGELRVQIDPPLRAQRPATEATIPIQNDQPPPESPQWYAWRDGKWMAAADPANPTAGDPAVTSPALTSAARPATTRPAPPPIATSPVFPRLPRPPSTSELLARMETRPEPLPAKEQYHAFPRAGHTVFTHYVPLRGDQRIAQGESQEVILPGLEFDSEHMAIDRQRQLLYLIHDGQVIAMPLPGIVRPAADTRSAQER